jgi:hypothetical protein
MPKILVFYEDGMVKEMEMTHNPDANYYPTYSVLYNPFNPERWYTCFQFTMPNRHEWEPMDASQVNKQFRAYALISG